MVDETDPCLVKREEGEPMFVLLARDSAAPETLEFWARKRLAEIALNQRANTREERDHIEQVLNKADEFFAWRMKNRK